MAKKRNQKRRKKSFILTIIKYIFIITVFLSLAGGLFVLSVYKGIWGELPSYEELKNIRNDEASLLYSEDGEVIGKYYIENRTNVNFGHITNNAVNALIATEDVRFYEHEGIDNMSMLRVLFKTLLLQDHSSGGGSTISQQLAKNLYPREEQQVTFMPVIKLKEMFIAHRLEHTYTKDEILTLYLNTVAFGENTYGIESASQKYFSTSASELTIPQAATLVGMLKGPSRYNPRLRPERALQRRNTVINQMVKYNFLTDAIGEKMKNTDLQLNYKPIDHYSGLAPYLREKIRQDADKILASYNTEYGTNYSLYKDGLTITATLDAEMQRYAEEAVSTHMRQLQESYYAHLGKQEPWSKNPQMLDNAIRNSETYKRLKHSGKEDKEIRKIMNEKKVMLVYSPSQGEARVEFSSIDSIKHYLKILQPGMIAVEPQTGKIKVWIGGINYKYFQYDQVEAPRQVGSVFKPVVYDAAINHGARTDAYYKNEQKTYTEYDNWAPRNSDDTYEGYYTLKGALSQSVNTIAVEVMMQTGIDTVIAHARRLGIESELPPYPSLALGVANIPLQEMINPFACFANNGTLIKQYYLKEIKDRNGKIIYQAPVPDSHNAISPNEAHIMSNMLMAVIDEGTGARLRNVYGLKNEIAGKTGTTQNQADGWFISYNPRIVMGVRVGANDPGIHFNNTRLGQGANMALPIIGEFMQRCLRSNTYNSWNWLNFPLAITNQEREPEVPEFKDHLNFFDKWTNQKLEKRQSPEAEPSQTENDTPKEKHNLFKQIGKWFKNKQEN